MKLIISPAQKNQHSDIVTGVCWTPNGELLSCSDDKSILRWNSQGESQGKVGAFDSHFTGMHWFPSVNKAAAGQSDTFAVACSDGSFKIVSKTGRLEKSVDAHRGAVICLKWNYEGTALATGGEDGSVKIWSRSGMLRSTLAQNDVSVFGICWSPESDQILYIYGKNLIVKPLQPSSKQIQWRAHDLNTLCVDWNPISNLIVSAGEDCRYKVWDSFGRQMYASPAMRHPITAVRWSPDGDYFGIGAFETLWLCDRNGVPQAKEAPRHGSIFTIDWTPDGTEMACGCGSGDVAFGQIVGRRVQYKQLSATLLDANKVVVSDVVNETSEELEFRDRVVKMSLGFGYLLVITAAQCHIYSVNNWNTPHIFDLKAGGNVILQAERFFSIIDNISGITVYNYEGKIMSNPRVQGVRPEFLNERNVSLSNDCVAVIDKTDPKFIRCINAITGKPLGDPVKHVLEVIEVHLSQSGGPNDRKVAFIDRNKDLYISPATRPQPVKLGTMVETVCWNDTTEILAAILDQKFSVWYYPNVAYVDRELLSRTRANQDGSIYGQSARITSFQETHCSIRRADGAVLTASVSPFPQMLYGMVEKGDWEHALRLCRFVKDEQLWAQLAGMSIALKELNTAEVAYAAVDEVDNVQYINYVKKIPTPEGRNAALLAYAGKVKEAENILLQAGLTYRAIMMNLDLHRWQRALELALQNKSHIDTVLYHRESYLRRTEAKETQQSFIEASKKLGEDGVNEV
mmetsp:Transcript_12473/g.33372  ORF Transcript_12473/g.33372 Transcript_12473/m.33372 type:complete len:742 (-) Transcript_12473:178-2403(-)